MSNSTTDPHRKEQLRRSYEEKLRRRQQELERQLEAHGGNLRRMGTMNALSRAVMGDLNYMTYPRLSDYFRAKGHWIFDALVYPRYKDAFLAIADGLLAFPYSVGYTRRPFRSGSYRSYHDRLVNLVLSFYHRALIDADIRDILTGNLPEDALCYLRSGSRENPGFVPEVLAYELDKGDAALEEIVIDILNGEGSFSTVSAELIRGIVMSHNAKLHEQLCKLLLAARLQEGLRQSICENADQGTAEAFLAIARTIEENDLMRFSSVKRAVGTWLGLLTDEARDLERVSAKSLQLMLRCLSDASFREECLAGEDTMAIYTALWSRAFYSTEDASVLLRQICENGTHHQLLTAGYFVTNLEEPLLRHTAARLVLKTHRDRYDLLAVYLPHFLPLSTYMANSISQNKPDRNTPFYFPAPGEAEEFCDWLFEAYRGLKKKELIFSPCIFPWFTAVLKRSDLLEKAMVAAAMVSDRSRMDLLCPHLSDCNPNSRQFFLSMLSVGEKTPAVRRAILAGLTDKAEYTRRAATELCSGLSLTQEEYMVIEDSLRLKQESIRRNAMELLQQQEDDDLVACLHRLLADSKSEKRTAALDILSQLKKQDRNGPVERCMTQALSIPKPTTQEKLLLDALMPKEKAEGPELFTQSDCFEPEVVVDEFVLGCAKEFTALFPNSELEQDLRRGKPVTRGLALPKAPCDAARAAKENLKVLSDYFHECRKVFVENDEEVARGTAMFGASWYQSFLSSKLSGDTPRWEEWVSRQQLSDTQLLHMYVLAFARGDKPKYLSKCRFYLDRIFGSGFGADTELPNLTPLRKLLNKLLEARITGAAIARLGVALGTWIALCLPEDMIFGCGDGTIQGHQPPSPFRYQSSDPAFILKDALSGNPCAHFISHPQLELFLAGLKRGADPAGRYAYPVQLRLNLQAYEAVNRYARRVLDPEQPVVPLVLQTMYGLDEYRHSGPCPLQASHHLYAHYHGLINRRQLYYRLMQPEMLKDALILVTSVQAVRPEEGQTVSSRCFSGYRGNRLRRYYEAFVEHAENEQTQQELVALCHTVARELTATVLEPELRRGDSPEEYSKYVDGIQTLFGAELFVRILKALGKDTLDRSYEYSGSKGSRRSNLSCLLARCAPAPQDTPATLAELLAGTDITRQRLIEAALFSPAWIDLIGQYLNLPGFKSACYYFMAHMNEEFDEDRKAVIARYTPLTDDELKDGSFDLNWFRSAYAELGETAFDRVYDAAKYISDGSKHARARKYADAALGRLDVGQTEDAIRDKRNKDLLMAYALIPLTGEAELNRRYLFIHNFRKESRSFGAQRSASEKKASDIALRNLATNAGFSDPMRLTLMMEAKLVKDNAELFQPHSIGDWVFCLTVDDTGTAAVECTKDGKRLKSIPAGAKKDPWVLRLTETKKLLAEQYRRTRRMLEQAMEDGGEFTLNELQALWSNPVVKPLLEHLVLLSDTAPGFFDGQQLRSVSGEVLCASDADLVRIAHPVQLYACGQWPVFQKHLFEKKLVQPFKQVFRELYVKTADEIGSHRSLRYAGHQIQPKKAAACLKERRWVADVESGLQKVYYKEELVATIYALADWFTPADIEAPTLEYVAFFHRRTGEPVKIADVPEVIFSEVMRDVDLAVSVAHVGGVDPETSHSTVEMRAALVTLSLPLLRLGNVRLDGARAIIEGKLGRYAVHLGSGVVHQLGGAMVNILPVHSQHKGRIFLPFADDDPKTAEILSKILLLSEDHKLKDPTILRQLMVEP